MTTLPANLNTLLLADSGSELMYRLDAATGACSIAVDNPALKPNASIPITLGVNGVHFGPREDGYVYFTNSFQQPVFSRTRVDPATGSQTGPDEVVIESLTNVMGNPDDFTFDSTGAAVYIASEALDGLVKVDPSSGKTEVQVERKIVKSLVRPLVTLAERRRMLRRALYILPTTAGSLCRLRKELLVEVCMRWILRTYDPSIDLRARCVRIDNYSLLVGGPSMEH
jgi:hypothetical protein